jgi:hypothetical protein
MEINEKSYSKYSWTTNRWTEEEDSILKENYNKITTIDIQKLIPNRTQNAISNRITLLKLPTPFSPGENPLSHPYKLKFLTQDELLTREQTKKRKNIEDGVNRRKDFRYSLFNNAKSRAKNFNLPFEICIDDIVIPSHCPLLGIPIICGRDKSYFDCPSIDRKNSKLGYTKENCWVISHKANKIKNNATLDEIILLTENLKKYL